MSASERDKGIRWELNVCRLLVREGFPHAERNAIGREQADGDILGVPGWHVECKDTTGPPGPVTSNLRLGEWVDKARRLAPHGRWVIIAKRRGHPDAVSGFAIQGTPEWLRLHAEAGWRPPA